MKVKGGLPAAVTPFDRRPPVSEMDAEALHRELVTDAVARVATPLRRAIEAYDRIGRLTGLGAEEAYLRVRDEVTELTGVPYMPIG